MAPFHGWGSTVLRQLSHYEDSLLFTTTSPEIPDIYLIDFGRMTLEPPSSFEPGKPGLGIQSFNH